jgi:predicted dehydrogenase
MRVLRLAVVGMGWMGELHTRALLRLPHHYPELGARIAPLVVVDPAEKRRQAASERYGFERGTAHWHEAVEDPSVDLVSITGPNSLHAEVAIACARAGKAFWVEKPVGRFPQEAFAVAEAAEAAGVVTAVGFDYEVAPAVQRALSLVADGSVGAVQTYRGRFLADYAADPSVGRSWRFRREQAGAGVLGDLMSHVLDQALLLCGPVAEVIADQAIFVAERPEPDTSFARHFSRQEGSAMAPVENEDHLNVLVRFASGARGTLEVGRTVVGHNVDLGFDLHGSRGAISWRFERMNELKITNLGSSLDADWVISYGRDGFGDFDRFQPGPGIPMGYDDLKVIEASRFIRAVLEGRPARPDVATMAEVANVTAAIAASVASGRWEPAGEVDGEYRRHPTPHDGAGACPLPASSAQRSRWTAAALHPSYRGHLRARQRRRARPGPPRAMGGRPLHPGPQRAEQGPCGVGLRA